jgi:hypothetical protein
MYAPFAAMREFELTTEIDAPQSYAWQTLVALETWPQWNHLVPSGRGDVRVGAVLDLRMRRPDGGYRPHRPTVLALRPPDEVVLAASFGHRRALHMVHSLAIEPRGAERCRLRQRWEVTGLLVPVLWPQLVSTMARFAELGDDLAARVRSVPRETR